MSVQGKSRISFAFFMLVFLVWENVSGQQKANDFTKRFGAFDSKMSSLNGRKSKFNRMSPSTARRISVEEWPAHFSSFGGKRFPMGKAKILGSERITTNTIEIKTPLGDRVAGESFERATNKNLSKRDAAANAVQFRDAYYARLNDRVDEWMDKVNTMSLRDINRYQFRRDRSDEPGFPVQRAGMGDAGNVRSNKMPLTSGLSPKPKPSSIPAVGQYWMGPKTSKSSGKSTVSSDDNDLGNRPITSQSQPGKRNYKAVPKPILGPKTIRVEVGTAE